MEDVQSLEDLDLQALKAIALASIKKKEDATAQSDEPEDELAALRAAALLSKAGKSCSSNNSSESKVEFAESTESLPLAESQLSLTVDSDEDSEFSILAEIERGNIIESDDNTGDIESDDNTGDIVNTATDSVSLEDGSEKAIPELLEDSVDIAEFDEDMLLDDIATPAKAKQTEQLKVLERQKKRAEVGNGLTDSSRDRIRRKQHLSPPQQHRSRSRSPRRRAPLSPERQSSTSRHRSHNQTSNHKNHSERIDETQNKDSLRDGGNKILPMKNQPDKESRSVAVKSPVVPDPLANPSLTEEEREKLLNRKDKFSETKKISSNKKTVSLKNVKKKTSAKQRLGTTNVNVTKDDSELPAIVETDKLETEKLPSEQTKSSKSPAVRMKIKDRLGGFVAKTADKQSIGKKKRRVSIEPPMPAEPPIPADSLDIVKTSSKSQSSGDSSYSEFSDADSEEPGSISSRSMAASTKPPVLQNISPQKRNIWSSRSIEEYTNDRKSSEPSTRGLTTSGDSTQNRRADRSIERNNDNPSSYSLLTSKRLRDTKNVASRKRDLQSSHSYDEDLDYGKSSRLSQSREADIDDSTRERNRRNGDRRHDSKVIQPVRSVSRREERTSISDGKGQSQKEQLLDERIRKIQEQNARREERQKEIEKEKLLYG